MWGKGREAVSAFPFLYPFAAFEHDPFGVSRHGLGQAFVRFVPERVAVVLCPMFGDDIRDMVEFLGNKAMAPCRGRTLA